MAFPGYKSSQMLIDGLARAMKAADAVKDAANSVNLASQAGPVSAGTVLNLLQLLVDQKLTLQTSGGMTGMTAFAQEQIGNGTLVISTEFTNLIAAMDAVGGWITGNFPKDVNGVLLYETFDVNARRVQVTFSSVQLAPLRTLLTSLAAAVS